MYIKQIKIENKNSGLLNTSVLNNTMTKETIRVVICGDEGVGKSSLIVSLTKAEFIPTIQDVLPPISIPRDFSSSPTYSPKNTVLIDTSDSDLIALDHELKSADVIWLVYCDHESYDHVSLLVASFQVSGVEYSCHSLQK